MKPFLVAWTRGHGATVLWVLLIVLNAKSSVRGQAETPSLYFGGVKVTIGMSDAAVRATLKDYLIEPIQAESIPGSTFSVSLKLLRADGGRRMLGVVTFERGRLTRANRYWPSPLDPPEDPEFTVAEALYWALQNLRGHNCVVVAEQYAKGDVNDKTIEIQCPAIGRTVQVSNTRHSPPRIVGGVTVTEHIFQPRQ